jgi:predicted anti-sigma-YlaC factor YlaD
MTCPEASTALGAYVLGALEPDERREVEEHLRGCPACSAELAEFEGLPALLARVRPEDLDPVSVTPSPELFARMSAVAGTRRPRRSRTWALVAAAAALVVLGLGIGLAVWWPGSVEQTVTASSGPVEVTLTASEANDGSALDVAVAGLRPGETCSLVVVDRDGRSHPAGDWPVSEEGDGRWRGWADVDPGDLSEVVVLGDGGRELVRVPL